jgi:hypothetical protein
MSKIAVSIYCYNCLLFVFDLILCFVNHSFIFYALLLHNVFFFSPVCIKHNFCTWLWISFVWFQKFLQCITLDIFYILLICLYMWIYGMQTNYQYQYKSSLNFHGRSFWAWSRFLVLWCWGIWVILLLVNQVFIKWTIYKRQKTCL